MWDELNKFDRGRFSGTNSLIFKPAWADAEIEWWCEHMFKEHGLYPEDFGELLSASAQGPKIVTLSDLDVKANSFVIHVKGRPNEIGEAWWHQRKLDLSGPIFEAQRMWIPKPEHGQGRGRLLMADLIDTAARLGVRRITLEADDVGRYAWACLGFLPDRASWNYHIRLEGLGRLARSRNELKPEVYHAYQDVLSNSNPLLIRNVIQWKQLVSSAELYGPDGEPMPIAIGKAILLETGARWYGEFDLEDPETMSIFDEYVGRK